MGHILETNRKLVVIWRATCPYLRKLYKNLLISTDNKNLSLTYHPLMTSCMPQFLEVTVHLGTKIDIVSGHLCPLVILFILSGRKMSLVSFFTHVVSWRFDISFLFTEREVFS